MKSMIITGAISGLGKELTAYFAEKAGDSGKEYAVCALARSADVLNEMAKTPNIHAYPCDVSKAGEVKDAFTRIIDDHGRIDVLINNAGIVPHRNTASRASPTPSIR
jgi:NAD(P)-dependent dehydrogenase (short-subunit alcohol dehydrogenase family)